MFKIVTVLAICWLSVSQAFDCAESPCPKHSKCMGQDKCECEYGYKHEIDKVKGLPYCRWQGTTTTKRTDTSNDNAGFQGDYSHEEDQTQDIESSKSKANGKPKSPVIMEESQTIVEGNENVIFNEVTTKIAVATSTEMWNMETSTATATATMETVTETNTETTTETNTETTTEATTEIPTSNEIPDLTTTTQETKAELPFKVDESEHHHNDAADDFQKFHLNNISQKEDSSANVQNSLDTTTDDLEVTTIRGVNKHVEEIIYKNSANQIFYNFLGILCPSLAFIFAVAVLFDCVKL